MRKLARAVSDGVDLWPRFVIIEENFIEPWQFTVPSERMGFRGVNVLARGGASWREGQQINSSCFLL